MLFTRIFYSEPPATDGGIRTFYPAEFHDSTNGRSENSSDPFRSRILKLETQPQGKAMHIVAGTAHFGLI